MRALALAIALAVPATAAAHGLRSAYLEVGELEPGRAVVTVRATVPGAALEVRAGEGCTLADSGERTWLLDCPGGLTGRTLTVDGLGAIVGDAVASIALADGTTATRLVRADAPVLELRPQPPTTLAVAREFVGLGLLHIITGYDHLLFLLLIVLLLREWRAVLLAETAFTLSHSLSFTATALGWIHVSSAAAEACIALSLVLLASEIDLRAPPPSRWRGAAMALVFGLVHGLGFAGGLREIGLPDDAIASALVGFAAGIELGQVAFLALALTALHLARRATRLQLAAVYAIGGISVCWLLERSLACF